MLDLKARSQPQCSGLTFAAERCKGVLQDGGRGWGEVEREEGFAAAN